MRKLVSIVLSIIVLALFSACSSTTTPSSNTAMAQEQADSLAVSSDKTTGESGRKDTQTKDAQAKDTQTVEEKIYNEFGVENGWIEYEYASNKSLVKKVTYRKLDPALDKLNRDFCVKEWVEYEYDGNGNVKKEIYREDGSISDEVDFEYDDNGHITKRIDYDNFEIGLITLCETDSNGNITKAEEFEPDGTPCGMHMYAYDEGNQLISDQKYNADGTVGLFTTYQYDIYGNRVRQEVYLDNCIVDAYEYTSDGNVSKEENYDHGEISGWFVWEYDFNGNAISRTEYYDEGRPHEKQLYDKDGLTYDCITYDN